MGPVPTGCPRITRTGNVLRMSQLHGICRSYEALTFMTCPPMGDLRPSTTPMRGYDPGQLLAEVKYRQSFLAYLSGRKPVTMGKEYSPGFRNRAVGMVFAGQSLKSACSQLNISRTQLCNWVKRARAGDNLLNKPGCGRKPSLHPVAKRVIAMAATKRHQSTRKLAKRLTAAGYRTSKSSVHRYFRKNLGLHAFKTAENAKIDRKTAQGPP